MWEARPPLFAATNIFGLQEARQGTHRALGLAFWRHAAVVDRRSGGMDTEALGPRGNRGGETVNLGEVIRCDLDDAMTDRFPTASQVGVCTRVLR